MELGQIAVQVDSADPAGNANDVPHQVPQNGVNPGEGWAFGRAQPARHFVG